MQKKLGYPVKLTPCTKDYIWGGDKLKTEWNKKSDTAHIAECWELSTFKGNESIICGGELNNLNLNEVSAIYDNIFGKKLANFATFPILIKLIDAKGDLSIQVHPTDEYALKNEGQLGKTEMWYIAGCDKGASIYYGFNRDVSRAEVALSIKNNTICSLLNEVKVEPYQYFFVPAGTVHAIKEGITIIEIQESSSVTYRLYDYDRVDSCGNKRELHIDKALDVLNYKKTIVERNAAKRITAKDSVEKTLATCAYFVVKEVTIDGSYMADTKDTFVSFTVASGSGAVNGLAVQKGDTIFIPADINAVIKGNLKIILTSL